MARKKAEPLVEDFAARWGAVWEQARKVNHEVRLVVFPGGAEAGEQRTIRLLDEFADPTDLANQFALTEEYLASDEAAKRGELLRKRSQREADVREARRAYTLALAALAETEDAVARDREAEPASANVKWSEVLEGLRTGKGYDRITDPV